MTRIQRRIREWEKRRLLKKKVPETSDVITVELFAGLNPEFRTLRVLYTESEPIAIILCKEMWLKGQGPCRLVVPFELGVFIFSLRAIERRRVNLKPSKVYAELKLPRHESCCIVTCKILDDGIVSLQSLTVRSPNTHVDQHKDQGKKLSSPATVSLQGISATRERAMPPHIRETSGCLPDGV